MLCIEYKQLGSREEAKIFRERYPFFRDMTAMRCPFCDTFLQGDGEGPLSIALKGHLLEAHHLRAERDVLSGVKFREHDPQMWEGMKSGAVPTDRAVGEDVEESVLCPFCGERFFGHDGEDLTQHLIAHFQDVHGIRTPGRSLTLVR